MFTEGEQISRSLFHEATHKLQNFFSTESLRSLEIENQKNPEDKSLLAIFYKLIKQFLKTYSIRFIFILLMKISKTGLTKILSLEKIYNLFFNKTSTLRFLKKNAYVENQLFEQGKS